MDIKFESILMTDTMPNLVKKVNSAQDTLKSNILNILNGLDINVGNTSSSGSGSDSSGNTIGTNTPIDGISSKTITLRAYDSDPIMKLQYSFGSSGSSAVNECGSITVGADGKATLDISYVKSELIKSSEIEAKSIKVDSIESNDSALDVNGISIKNRLNYDSIKNPETPDEDTNSITISSKKGSYLYVTNEDNSQVEIFFEAPEVKEDSIATGDVFNLIFDKKATVLIQKTEGSDVNNNIEIIGNKEGKFEVEEGNTLKLVVLAVYVSSPGSSSEDIKYKLAACILK